MGMQRGRQSMIIVLWSFLLFIALMVGALSVIGFIVFGIATMMNQKSEITWLKKFPYLKGLIISTVASFILVIGASVGLAFSIYTDNTASPNQENLDAAVLSDFTTDSYIENRLAQIEEANQIAAEEEAKAIEKEKAEKEAAELAAKEKAEKEAKEKAAEKEKKKKAKKKKENKKLAEMKVHFIDVGQADAALIQYDDKAILIDSGNWNANETVAYLQSIGIKKIDLVVGSHPHADHIGQIDKVIDAFPVDEVWMSGGETTSNVFERVMSAIDEKGIGYDEPRAGDNYTIGNLKIDILSPNNLTGDLNDDSIVMKLTYGGISFLFTGDAEKSAESTMVNSGQKIQSTILKVGHHGSDTSSTEAFVNAVNPKAAIISVGENSQYNHPNESVIDRYTKKDIDLYATNAHGTIIVTTNGKTYDINTNKDGTVKPGSKAKKQTKKKTNKTSEKPKQNTTKETKQKTEKKTEKKTESNGSCVDINTASESDIKQIIHIGDVRAPDVIANRPYNSVDDLTKIKGIATARIADIKQQGVACVN